MTMTLVPDLFSRIFVSGACILLFEVGIPGIGMCMYLEMKKCSVPSLGHCDLDLVFRIGIESGAYILYSCR